MQMSTTALCKDSIKIIRTSGELCDCILRMWLVVRHWFAISSNQDETKGSFSNKNQTHWVEKFDFERAGQFYPQLNRNVE